MFRMRAAGYRGPDLFSGPVVKRIASASQGLTRRVNLIADKALLVAFSENTHTIRPKHVDGGGARQRVQRQAARSQPVALCMGRGPRCGRSFAGSGRLHVAGTQHGGARTAPIAESSVSPYPEKEILKAIAPAATGATRAPAGGYNYEQSASEPCRPGACQP